MAESSVQAKTETPTILPLWILEGKIDLPIQAPWTASGATANSMFLFLGGENVDGFVELLPVNIERVANSVFWSASNPVEWRLRASVRAPDMTVGLMRAAELMEHVADRLAFMAGQFVRPLALGVVYNEEELRDCVAGRRTEFDMTSGGEFAIRTQPMINPTIGEKILFPPNEALTALRWFRRGMAFHEKVDQFIAFYIALESIAEHLPDTEAEALMCSNCQFQYGKSKTNAGIASLINGHKNFPPNARQHLAMLRARIVHGTADDAIRYNAAANAQVVQRLAADGIARVLGIDAAQINFSINPLGGLGGLQPAIAPIGRARYENAHSPLADWDGRFHSDVCHDVLNKLKANLPQ